MGERKAILMILKVDLNCECCCERIKKVLCKFPQIRDRIFDEKSNTVTIKVFCCDPEMIRYELWNKSDGSIKSIEIKELEQPKSIENPIPDPSNHSELPSNAPPAAKPESQYNHPAKSAEPGQNQAPKATESAQKYAEPIQYQTKHTNYEPRPVEPMHLYGSEPIPTCCEECYGRRSDGPRYYDAYSYGRMGYNGYGPSSGPNRLCNPARCADFFSEENPAGCSVM